MASARELLDKGKIEEAVEIAKRELAEDFDNADAIAVIGDAAMATDNLGLAFMCFEKWAKLRPQSEKPINNMGNCLSAKQRFEDAEPLYRKAIELNPKSAPAMNNMAYMHLLKREPEKCIEWANKALAVDPGQRYAKWNRSLAYLQLGRWKEGWEHYDTSLGTQYRNEINYTGEPRWDGRHGKNIVVCPEQGLGDELSFASCIPDLVRVSRKVVIECDHRLERLFTRSFPECDVFGTRFKKDSDWPDKYRFDARVNIGSLPRFFRNAQDAFPGTPYLTPDPELVRGWKAILEPLKGKKIGIAWNGGVRSTNSVNRSLPVDLLKPLSEVAHLVSLEYKAGESRPWIKEFPWIRGDDYDHVAALVASLDCVVSVTTAVVHLAGALGTKCYVMAPKNPRWLYGLDGDSIPWYRSLTICRGEFADQITKIKAAINGDHR